MFFSVDDLCLSHLDKFELFDKIKARHPSFKLVAFTIANNKNNELLTHSKTFKAWYLCHKDWVEIAVHSYDHEYPPDGDRNNEGKWIKKARDSLRPFLPAKYGYRSPGWQTTNKTVPILKKLGFSYIAYETVVKDTQKDIIIERQVTNSHLYDIDSIKRLGVIANEILQH